MKDKTQWVPKTEEERKIKEIVEWVVENPDSEEWSSNQETLPITHGKPFSLKATRGKASVYLYFLSDFMGEYKHCIVELCMDDQRFDLEIPYGLMRLSRPFKRWLCQLGDLAGQRVLEKRYAEKKLILDSTYKEIRNEEVL